MKSTDSLLVKILGFPATLIHGDSSVFDRWRWVAKRLPITRNDEQLLDVGCGTGAFTIGTARRGYHATGLSWDVRNQTVARERASLCGVASVEFPIGDARELHSFVDFKGRFDVVVCCECIEHIINDRKLMIDLGECLKPGGRLLLTCPNVMYNPIVLFDAGPFRKIEDGWHVRKGYSPEMLRELCVEAGLKVEEIGYCAGFFTQVISWILVKSSRVHYLFGWALSLPLRVLPPLLDGFVHAISKYPYYSICLHAYKPRFRP